MSVSAKEITPIKIPTLINFHFLEAFFFNNVNTVARIILRMLKIIHIYSQIYENPVTYRLLEHLYPKVSLIDLGTNSLEGYKND